MNKYPSLSRDAAEKAKTLDTISQGFSSGEIEMIGWDDSGDIGLAQGGDTVVLAPQQQAALAEKIRARTLTKDEFIYVIVIKGKISKTTRSREHAWELVKAEFPNTALDFSGWENGEVSRVSKSGFTVATVHCIEISM